MPIGKSGYTNTLIHSPTETQLFAQTTLFRVNLKSKIKSLKGLSFSQIALLPYAIFFVLSLKLLNFLFDVRIHTVKNHRIGHFATNTELSRLSSSTAQRISQKKQINIYCFQVKKHSNSFLARMWKRELFCLKSLLGQLVYDIGKLIIPKSTLKSTVADTTGLLGEFSPSLSFHQSELREGNAFINNLECKSKKGFVCLNVRDSSFFTKATPIGWHKNRDWSYHDYRDSDIKTYVAAAEALAERGYTVFRMGVIVKESLISKHPQVVDYATNGMRSEFLDIYLGAHCDFAISVGSGWDGVPLIFRKPMIWVNHLPVFEPSDMTLPLVTFPKILLDNQTNRFLKLDDLIKREISNSLSTQAYKDAGVIIRDLSSEELVEAVTEMAQRVEGTFVETPEQKEMQAKLRHILSTHPKLQPSPNFYPVRAQLASCFLSRYPNFLDGLD